MNLLFLLLATTPPDTTLLDSTLAGKVYIQEKSPGKALLLSILPGGGQFYTRNYLKGSAFFVIQTTFAVATIYEWILMDRAKTEGNDYEYEYFSNWLYNFFWIDGLVWTISMADAYISAHFYKFREQGSLEIGFNF